MKITKEKRQIAVFLLSVLVLVIAAGSASVYRAGQMGKVSFLEHLDEEIVVIDEESYPLRELAFYLAYQESTVEEQAKVYDMENIKSYWNLRSENNFLRFQARDTAMEMMVHDTIFFRLAEKENISLTAEEETYMLNRQMDFWNDLEEEGQERLGVSEEEIKEVFYRMALAQKQQQLLADSEGVDYREYNIGGKYYATLLAKHSYQINEELWERLDFGNIIFAPGR
ncbi:MAG: hypothetical protein J6A92_04830 [Lachnospiraceae bacterium]|nr:hypothetical protein [Lachnospiraceae bacterium]